MRLDVRGKIDSDDYRRAQCRLVHLDEPHSTHEQQERNGAVRRNNRSRKSISILHAMNAPNSLFAPHFYVLC